VLGRRQRDVHDGGIKNDHELGNSDDDKDKPAVITGGCRPAVAG